MPIGPCDTVFARGALWQVESIEQGHDCRALRLVRLHPPPSGLERTLLEPFDRIQPSEARPAGRVVIPGHAHHLVRTLLATDRRWREPACAATTDVDLLTWQIVPAIALLTGRSRRILLADAVGSGKTIQAGIIARELLNRRPDARVLVLAPAGLRQQWHGELAARFGLQAEIANLDWVDRTARALPPGVNPWSTPQVIVSSLDFAKRTEILPGPEHLVWDLVIVDEAHVLGAGTSRYRLAQAVCQRAARVLLLTATPHDGNDTRFDRLCGIGGLAGEPPLTVIRRERPDLHSALPQRRWCVLRVRSTPDEHHLRAFLDRYIARLEADSVGAASGAARLLAPMLRKRLASSAWALALTLTRRRTLLEQGPDHPVQTALPMFEETHGLEDDIPDVLLRLPGLRHRHVERAWLGALAEAAGRAAGQDSKIRLLRRWMRRVPEALLIFMEYRDTLSLVARAIRRECDFDVLHGGLTSSERERSLRGFLSGRTRVLLATDAASEGLNLHRNCRTTIMLDLPWTPTRLEQRIGRLDRLGQRRRVHAIALVSSEFDVALIRRLQDKRERAAGLLTGPAEPPDRIALDVMAAEAMPRLAAGRTLLLAADRSRRSPVTKSGGSPPPTAGLPAFPPGLTSAYLGVARRPCQWSGAMVLIDALLRWQTTVVDRAAIGLHIPIAVPRLRSRRDVRRFVEQHLLPMETRLIAIAGEHLVSRWQQSKLEYQAYAALSRHVHTAIRHHVTAGAASQPSLFGRYDDVARTPPASSAIDFDEDVRDNSDPVERISMALILLRSGSGRPPSV